MTGLDTSILVRYLTQDDSIQSPVATEILEKRLSEANPGFISVVVIAEMVWVLDRAYGFESHETAGAIERLLQADRLVVEHEQEVFEAMLALRAGHAEFADALIGALGSKAGCTRTLTFNRQAARLPGFALAPF